MKFLIVTHVDHYYQNGKWYAYAPYVREMNIWFKYVDEVIIVAPCFMKTKSAIDIAYEHQRITFIPVPLFDITSVKSLLKTLVKLPGIVYKVFWGMKKADHIHLRCPGNMGLVGSLVQIAFPNKRKTAKYAGNWDPESTQPATYKWQKKILSNTYVTRNMQVLVYGNWPGITKNIKPFFTATYQESDKKPVLKRTYTGKIKFLFVGSLVVGKQPFYAINVVEDIHRLGYHAELEIYGQGNMQEEIKTYIEDKGISGFIKLMGAKPKQEVEDAYTQAHFMILPSKSEGWPKVVAEAMFWGCIPLVTPVSCVPYMLDNQNRGLLLTLNRENDVNRITGLLKDTRTAETMIKAAVAWSRNYTLDTFEAEIKKLL